MTEINKILKATQNTYKVNPKERTRRTHWIWARVAFYVEMRKLGYSLHDIGEQVGFDHSTVIHGLKLHDAMFNRDKSYMLYYNRFLREMGYDVKEEVIAVVEYREFTTGQEALIELIKQVPDELCESVYVKLEAIVRMSKVTHKIK